MPTEFRRDHLTWTAYTLLAWFAYLQAAPALLLGHLREELHLSYSTGGLHVAAFAAGCTLSGILTARLERALGRRAVLWSATTVMGAGAIGLTLGRTAPATIGSVLGMGLGGGLLLATVQAALADQHGERRAVALAEGNLAAGLAYAVLIGALSLTAAIHAGWRVAVLGSLAVPVLVWGRSRRLAMTAAQPAQTTRGRLPGVFWIAAAMLFCTTAAEWCVTAWGASFVEDALDVSADMGVALMAGYFAGVVVGRVSGSRLARRHEPPRLIAVALAVTAAGFATLWPAATPAQAVAGLLLLGAGIGNLFPMGISAAVALAPEQAVLASGRAVAVTSLAGLLAPLTVGPLADATSLKAALTIVPVCVVVAGVSLALIGRARAQASAGLSSALGAR